MGEPKPNVASNRSGPKKIRLTKQSIQTLKPPKSGRDYWYDDRTPTLAVCVTATGKRTFYSVRKIDGRTVRIRFGTFPEITIEQARNLCVRASAAVSEGRNPHAEKRERRQEWTVGELFDWYMAAHSRPHVKSWREEQRLYDRYLTGWGSRRLSSVKRSDVQALHQKIGTGHGQTAANRLIQMFCNVFNVASRLEVWSGDNPASKIRKFKLKARERFLQPDEVPKLFEAIDADASPDIADYVRLAIFTGARRWNLLTMRWDQIDLKEAIWTIPETKNGDTVRIALAPPALEILTHRQKIAAETEKLSLERRAYVFPSRTATGKYPHLSYPHVAWWRICKRAGLEDLRLHDLRRSLGSWQAAAGASLSVIGKSLGHKSQSATAIYARLNLDPVRQSVEAAVAAMIDASKSRTALEGEPDENRKLTQQWRHQD
ncbi:tyrosine-type recombinase/integrase [Planctomicrobium sp. SH664]|uniref:tyrosine-type recombinase/integrase n=1 Tax=Planctomicrobium sp. SH664 TaxID=3448125 RepID=UPI003F5C0B40